MPDKLKCHAESIQTKFEIDALKPYFVWLENSEAAIRLVPADAQ
jgi:hypothetical protein